MTGKRRLQLLPEVLPKPERGPSDPGGPSPVRARALARLSVLAALATASGCGKAGDGDGGYGVVDPLPSPAYCPTLPAVLATYLPSPAVDAGAPGAESEGRAAPLGDAGAPRRVRVELLLPDEQLGRVTRVGPNVSLLQEDNDDGERLTLDLLIEDSLAEIDFGATCGAGWASYRARLRLLPDAIEAFVQRVGR
jgi:hypothetical protein